MINDITSGLRVPAQRPLNPKEYATNEATLANLGTNDNLAYTYHLGMRVLSIEERTIWEWREPGIVDEIALLPSNFTYPAGLIVDGVDYGNKEYNFFKILLPEDVLLELEDLITNLNSYQAANTGSGAGVYKDTTNPSATINQFNFKSLILAPGENTGTSLIQGIDNNTNDLTLKIKTLDSDTLIFDASVTGKLKINMPSVSSLLDFYVRCDATVTYFDWLAANTAANGGAPVPGYQYKGFGTIAKPFVDTIVYTLGFPATPAIQTPNTAVSNAKTAYIGLGTIFSPQFGGRRLRIQAASVQHVTSESFNVNGLIVRIETGGALYHTPIASTGEDSWMVNLDHSGIGVDTIFGVTFEIEANAYITIQKNGFKNKGTSIGTNNFITSKQIVIRSEGSIYQNSRIEEGAVAGDYRVFDMNAAGTGAGTGTYRNDGNALLSMQGGRVQSVINPIFKGGVHVSDFSNVEFNAGAIGANIDPNIVPFIESVAGLYTRVEKCSFYNFGNQTAKSFFKAVGQGSNILLIEPLVNGIAESLVIIEPHASNPDLDPGFTMYNSTTKDGITATVTLFKVNGVRVARWRAVYFNNNYISKGLIDETKVDLTGGNYQGVMNFIGRQSDSSREITYHLPRFGSRAAALGGTMEIGNIFINTNGLPIDTPDPSWFMDIII